MPMLFEPFRDHYADPAAANLGIVLMHIADRDDASVLIYLPAGEYRRMTVTAFDARYDRIA